LRPEERKERERKLQVGVIAREVEQKREANTDVRIVV
jgi:hypothetical protein